MILLLHPTHRKFIKLLRNKVNNGDVIYITKEDQSEWQSLFNTSKNSKKTIVSKLIRTQLKNYKIEKKIISLSADQIIVK